MSVIFQLFHAEDLKQLTPTQLEDLKQIVRQEVINSQDTLLNASLAIANHINRRHMQGLLPASYPTAAGPPSAVNISQLSATNLDQRTFDRLRERVREVFQQLTGDLPTGPSNPLNSTNLTSAPLLDQLLNEADLSKLDALDATAGTSGRTILAWALTCELANFNAYEAFEQIKQKTDEAFMNFMQANGKGAQRPIGPDTPYSPFYPGSALYHYRSGPNP
jgi:hypothetical protein